MKRISESRDIQSKIWKKWESLYQIEDPKNDDYIKNLTFDKLVNDVSPKNVDDWIKNLALNRFLFELKYLRREPIYTLKWLYGEHVDLFNVYGCKKHQWVCVTHDDDRYIPDLSIFCPVCNMEIADKDKIHDYETIVEGNYLSKDEWDREMRWSKSVKKNIRKENIKYWIKKLFQKKYFIMSISHLFDLIFRSGG